MNWFRWKVGRTSPGNYQKMLLLQLPFMDVYLLRFPTGSSIDWHTDPIPNAVKRDRDGYPVRVQTCQHHRVNLFLRRAKKGGRLMSKCIVYDGERKGAIKLIFKHKLRLDYMRPDLTEHAVEKVKEGSALALSIGWVWKDS